MDKYNHCRISGSKNLIEFFILNTALAGGFLRTEEEFSTETQYPLTVSFCPESSLVQVNEVIAPEVLFSKYFYKTGAVKTLEKHFASLAEKYKNYHAESILEIGCNDFSMLKNLIGSKYKTIIGVDPSDVALEAKPEGVDLHNGCFNSKVAQQMKGRYGKIDIISASNCFAHIEDIKDVTLGIKNLLSSDGVAVIEVHWLGNIIKNLQFPFIYHEHMYYYSLKAMQYLMSQFDLSVFDVEEIDIHGGSIRYFIGHENKHNITENVSNLQQKEIELGLYSQSTYLNFSAKVEGLGAELKKLLNDIKSSGQTVYGYGASGQANTLMSFYGIDSNDIPLIIDDSPLKVGCYTPNNHIPIINPEILKTNPPDYLLCFAYTFLDEIKERNKSFKGKWITPLPTITILA